MDIQIAREVAARIWCDPEMSHLEMDCDKAEEIAQILSGRFDHISTWKQIAEELWQLLDDIDTFADMFHPDRTPYQRAVAAKAAKRFEFLESDGYDLFLTGNRLTPVAADAASAADGDAAGDDRRAAEPC